VSRAYYNEIDPFAAAWLRELIKDGAIAPGDVDERDINDVRPDELFGYAQWHLFAGIGAWSYALRAAGWPDSRPALTVSCPCQPFSTAGKRSGTSDERHLWPAAFHIISQLNPPVVFGEQVSQAVNHGWWDLVADDLEGSGYEVGAKDFPACSVGAFHKRQRLYFVADKLSNPTRDERGEKREVVGRLDARDRAEGFAARCVSSGTSNLLANPEHTLRGTEPEIHSNAHGRNGFGRGGDVGDMALTPSERYGETRSSSGRPSERVGDSGELNSPHEGFVGHADDPRSQGFVLGRDSARARVVGEAGLVNASTVDDPESTRRGIQHTENIGSSNAQINTSSNAGDSGSDGCRPVVGELGITQIDGQQGESLRAGTGGSPNGVAKASLVNIWSHPLWLYCRDGKYRAVERATESLIASLVTGTPGDLGLVRLENYPDREDAEAVIYAPLIAKGKQRVGRLRGYGNSLCAPAAIAFIEAYLESKTQVYA
jgi:DNA (cytosine-5)-methyltransferase 1